MESRAANAMQSLQKFINGVNETYGTNRDNLFRITIPTLDGGGEDELISMYADSVYIPSRTIITSPNSQLEGPTFETPHSISNEPVTVNFILDRDLTIRKTFHDWMKMVYDEDSNGVDFMNVYSTEIKIEALQADKETVAYTVLLKDSYPRMIGAVQFASSGQGNITTMTVEFVYTSIEE